MRNILTALVVASITMLIPMSALAGNQEVANRIAANLRKGGQLSGYKIAVKYQDGTAWVEGHVANQRQIQSALRTVLRTSGVDRVVNRLTVGPPLAAKPPAEPAAQPQVRAPVAQMSFNRPRTNTALRLSKARTGPTSLSTRLQESMKPQSIPEPSRPTQMFTPSLQRQSIPASRKRPNLLVTPMASAAMPVAAITAVPGAPNTARRVAYMQGAGAVHPGQALGRPIPMYVAGMGGRVAPARYDQPYMPNHAWPSYAAYPNYAALTYPKKYSPTAWPFIGPFYPYPQVPLAWRKVTLEWDDGWWTLDFKDSCRHRH